MLSGLPPEKTMNVLELNTKYTQMFVPFSASYPPSTIGKKTTSTVGCQLSECQLSECASYPNAPVIRICQLTERREPRTPSRSMHCNCYVNVQQGVMSN